MGALATVDVDKRDVIVSRNPSTGDIIGEVRETSAAGIATGEVIMALLAGNGVVLKPSEVTPLIALKTKEIFDACGLDPELFHVVPGRGAAGAALIDAGIDYCVFTGSTATGRKVAAAC